MFATSFPLVALNSAVALFILARFFYRGLKDTDQTKWHQSLAVSGGAAIVIGSPLLRGLVLGGIAGSPIDVMSTLMGFFFIGLAAALWRGWSLFPLGVYAVVAGLVGVISGLECFGPVDNLGVAAGLLFAGLGCFAIPDVIHSRKNQMVGAYLFGVSAFFWLIVGLGALRGSWHLTINMPTLG